MDLRTNRDQSTLSDLLMPHATVLYHYFHPDDVVSARHLSDLAEGLARRGWTVTALPCHRGCRDESKTYPPHEFWRGVDIHRVWRPGFKQASNKGRVLNAAWMLARWSWAAFVEPRRGSEVVIIGTDPILSVLTTLPWRFFRTRTQVAHWCFDLYPEAAVADGLIRQDSRALSILNRFLKAAYRRCSLLADLGVCMAKLLKRYDSNAKAATLVPWALVEPMAVESPDPRVRHSLFGETKLGILYSGTFGRAHSYTEFLELARLLRGSGIQFCFAGRGNRTDELRAAITPEDSNVSFAGFAPEADLEKRLTACDLHLVSLRPEWTGTVVPSKFFGALAVGRGVIFAGSPDSAIAHWIREYRVGWVLTPDELPTIAQELRVLAQNPAALDDLRQRCFDTYQKHFSKEIQLDRWDSELRKLL